MTKKSRNRRILNRSFSKLEMTDKSKNTITLTEYKDKLEWQKINK